MTYLYERPDLACYYDQVLKSFLESEHVSSEEEWLALFREIYLCSEETARKELNLALDTFFKIKEIETDNYVKNLILSLKDTSCLILNRDTIDYINSFKYDIKNSFYYIIDIIYSDTDGSLIISGLSSLDKKFKTCIYKALSESQEKSIKEFNQSPQATQENKTQFYLNIWKNSNFISFFQKLF